MLARRALVAVIVLAGLAGAGLAYERRAPTRRIAPAREAMAAGCGLSHGLLRGAKETVDGRAVHVWAPSSYDPLRSYPIVLMLHGFGGNGPAFEGWFEMEKYVDDGAVVVYPDAAHGGVWDFHGDGDLDFLSRVLDAIETSYCVDRRQVLVFGFSFGSKMAQHLGCKRPDLVRAVAAGAGPWADPSPRCVSPLPVIVVHRTHDTDEDIERARGGVAKWAVVDGCSAATDPSELGLGCVRHRDCEVNGGLTFCEDTQAFPTWKKSWQHTVREPYRRAVWTWFRGLPAPDDPKGTN